MNREISQRELRNSSAEVLRAVQDGESITITSNGTPVAELVPLRRGRFVDALKTRTFVLAVKSSCSVLNPFLIHCLSTLMLHAHTAELLPRSLAQNENTAALDHLIF